MGALLSLVLKTPALTSLLGAVANDGVRRLSKTKIGANAGFLIGPDWADLLPRAIALDPEAIGKIVLLAGAWAFTLWGRGNTAN